MKTKFNSACIILIFISLYPTLSIENSSSKSLGLAKRLTSDLEQKEAEVSDIRLKLLLLGRFPDCNEKLSRIITTGKEFRQIMFTGPKKIFQGAQFGPYVEKEKIVGYYVAEIKSTHFYFILGLRKGDIIRSLNQKPLTNQEEMLEFWKHMRKISADGGFGVLEVGLERGKKLYSVIIEVKPEL